MARTELSQYHEIMYDLGKIMENIELIKDRLSGPSIGKVSEEMTLRDLKSAFPQDGFSEEASDKHGTDILSTVKESDIEIGRVSISVKYQKKWASEFIVQLEKNISQHHTD